MSYTIMGRVSGHHYIEDLRLMVPYRVAVTISAEDYLRSKDLHRALQQGTIMELQYAPNIPTQAMTRPHPVAVPTTAPDPSYLKGLGSQVEELRREVAGYKGLESKLEQQGYQLEAILGAIKDIHTTTVIENRYMGAIPGPSSDVVGGDAPAFIPSQIVPTEAQARVNIQTAEGADIGKAASKLRELRKRQQGDKE